MCEMWMNVCEICVFVLLAIRGRLLYIPFFVNFKNWIVKHLHFVLVLRLQTFDFSRRTDRLFSSKTRGHHTITVRREFRHPATVSLFIDDATTSKRTVSLMNLPSFAVLNQCQHQRSKSLSVSLPVSSFEIAAGVAVPNRCQCRRSKSLPASSFQIADTIAVPNRCQYHRSKSLSGSLSGSLCPTQPLRRVYSRHMIRLTYFGFSEFRSSDQNDFDDGSLLPNVVRRRGQTERV